MRKLFEDIQAHVSRFLDQRDDLLLVVRAGPREHVALCNTLEGLEQGSSPHVFWLFTDAFVDSQHYAAAAANAFQTRHEALRAALSAEGGRPPAPLPAGLLDERRPPEQRLRELLMFARSQIVNLQEQLLVAAFLPDAIRDAAAYARLVDALLEHEFPVPWFHHIRLIVREDAPSSASSEHKQSRTRTRWFAPDLSDAALERALEAEVDDAAQPIQQRMQSLLILAGMDSAHRRTEQALEKYGLLASYHSELGELPLLALALNGMGEACALAERPVEAREHFERALTPAIEAKDLPSLTSITFNLARLHQGLGEWRVAVEYYEGLSTLARASLNAPLQLITHEQRGVCLHELSQDEPALEQWRAGVTLAEGVGMQEQQLGLLQRIAELLTALGRAGESREVERQMAALRTDGAQVPL
jgi:tetratricopeptide (TPR) repeat protein